MIHVTNFTIIRLNKLKITMEKDFRSDTFIEAFKVPCVFLVGFSRGSGRMQEQKNDTRGSSFIFSLYAAREKETVILSPFYWCHVLAHHSFCSIKHSQVHMWTSRWTYTYLQESSFLLLSPLRRFKLSWSYRREKRWCNQKPVNPFSRMSLSYKGPTRFSITRKCRLWKTTLNQQFILNKS